MGAFLDQTPTRRSTSGARRLAVQLSEKPLKSSSASALISDTRREIERLKAVVAETNLLLAHSRALISSSRDLLVMLEHDRDLRSPSRNAAVGITIPLLLVPDDEMIE